MNENGKITSFTWHHWPVELVVKTEALFHEGNHVTRYIMISSGPSSPNILLVLHTHNNTLDTKYSSQQC